MFVAKQYNLIYVHTTFDFIRYSEGDKNFLENFFNLAKNQVNINELNKDSIDIKYIKHISEIRNKENILYVTQSFRQYVDKYPDTYLNLLETIKNKFYYKFQDSFKNYNENNALNIGLHIRRGNVNKCENTIRFTNNLYYVSIVNRLIELVHSININIHSQGSIDDFKEFVNYNTFYHLDECLLITFYNLIESDILLMSESTLSYCARLFNENIVLYEPFWNSLLSKWNVIKNVNSINSKKLLKQIEKLCTNKNFNFR